MHVIQATATTATQASNLPQPRLVRAAHEFEAQMMKALLKPMTAGDALISDEDKPDSCGVLEEFASEALGRALSEQGGLGIANSVLRSLSHTGNASRSGSDTENRNEISGLRGRE